MELEVVEVIDERVLSMVQAHGRVSLGAALEFLKQLLPEITSFEVAESISRLHRRGMIRISEELVVISGEKIAAAFLTRP